MVHVCKDRERERRKEGKCMNECMYVCMECYKKLINCILKSKVLLHRMLRHVYTLLFHTHTVLPGNKIGFANFSNLCCSFLLSSWKGSWLSKPGLHPKLTVATFLCPAMCQRRYVLGYVAVTNYGHTVDDSCFVVFCCGKILTNLPTIKALV